MVAQFSEKTESYLEHIGLRFTGTFSVITFNPKMTELDGSGHPTLGVGEPYQRIVDWRARYRLD